MMPRLKAAGAGLVFKKEQFEMIYRAVIRRARCCKVLKRLSRD